MANTSAYHDIITDNSFAFYPSFKQFIKNYICRPHTCHRSESEGAYALQYGIETAYPLLDIRLAQFVYSLPAGMFKPVPYTRMPFRNLCEDILPDKVRYQDKHSGALTLAFAEYWYRKQFDDFENTEIKNYNNLFNVEKYNNGRSDFKQSGSGLPPVIMHYLSECIKMNT